MSEIAVMSDFARPDPTPADCFFWAEDPGTPEARQCIMAEVFDKWRAEGVSQVRVTLTGPGAVDDKTGYPAGLWLEGWKDPKAVQLSFGTGYPDESGPIYPPLAAA